MLDVTFPYIVIVVSVISSAIHFATEINQVMYTDKYIKNKNYTNFLNLIVC